MVVELLEVVAGAVAAVSESYRKNKKKTELNQIETEWEKERRQLETSS